MPAYDMRQREQSAQLLYLETIARRADRSGPGRESSPTVPSPRDFLTGSRPMKRPSSTPWSIALPIVLRQPSPPGSTLTARATRMSGSTRAMPPSISVSIATRFEGSRQHVRSLLNRTGAAASCSFAERPSMSGGDPEDGHGIWLPRGAGGFEVVIMAKDPATARRVRVERNIYRRLRASSRSASRMPPASSGGGRLMAVSPPLAHSATSC